MANYSHEQISLLIKCFWRGIWPQFPFYRPLFIYFSQNYFQKEKKSSRGKELQNSSHSRSTKEGCVARGVEQEWVWEKEERNRRAANTQGPMESLDLSANAKRTTKALEVTGGTVWLQRRLSSELPHEQRSGDLDYEQGDELKSYLGFLASSHGKPEAREGWNSH